MKEKLLVALAGSPVISTSIHAAAIEHCADEHHATARQLAVILDVNSAEPERYYRLKQ